MPGPANGSALDIEHPGDDTETPSVTTGFGLYRRSRPSVRGHADRVVPRWSARRCRSHLGLRARETLDDSDGLDSITLGLRHRDIRHSITLWY